jgi:hypothetical protein
MLNEKDLKKILTEEENKIIRDTVLYSGQHSIDFSREHNKLVRLAVRRFYREAIYPYLRELNLNPPRKYED